MLFYPILAIGIVSTIVFIVKRTKDGGVKALMLKAFSSVMFVSCAIAAGYNVRNSGKFSFALLIIAALIFGLLGDIWLDLKWVYPKDNDIFTFAGFISFGIGHIIFVVAMLLNFTDTEKPFVNNYLLYIIIPVILSLIMGVGIIVLEKPMKSNYGKFKSVTAVYSFFLALTTFMAGSLAILYSFKCWTLNIMFIGAVFFMLSDLILCGTYFGEGKNRPFDIAANHTAYYIAQFLIASSVMFLT